MNCGRIAIALSLLILIGQSGYASEIYTWVDDEGVVHYSDTRPADDTPVETRRLKDTNPPDYDPADDPYSIANQAKRTNDRYAEVEEAREERDEEREKMLALVPYYLPYPYDPYRHHGPGYYYRPSYPGRPVHRPTRQLPTIRRQVRAMDELGLSGARPHSINSSAHHARVESSSNFLDSVRQASPPARPTPY